MLNLSLQGSDSHHKLKLCFWNLIYPDKLKIAKVIPLYKKCESHLTKNYRTISLLSILNKIIEKLVHKHLYQFLQKYEILYKFQLGFRKDHSTSLANIEIVENIREEIQNGKFVLGAYRDLTFVLALGQLVALFYYCEILSTNINIFDYRYLNCNGHYWYLNCK